MQNPAPFAGTNASRKVSLVLLVYWMGKIFTSNQRDLTNYMNAAVARTACGQIIINGTL